MGHQAMGYDRASIIFSPDGRLLQVEYAKKTVKRGSDTVGIVCKDGVLLLTNRRIVDKLIVARSVEKVFQVDDHIGAAAAGILSDGRILIEKAQVLAQQHRVSYDEPIDSGVLVKELCNMKQAFTQYGGARPFGVSLMVVAADKGKAKLYVTDPTGIYFEYKATAIGESEDELKEFLGRKYKETLNLDDGLKLGVDALKTVLGKEFSLEKLDGCYIKHGEGFHRLKKEQLKKLK